MAIVAMALAGCSSESPDNPGDGDEDARNQVELRLDVSFGLQPQDSRTDLGDRDGYEGPQGEFEKVATLRVIILGEDGKTLEGNRMVRLDDALRPVGDNLNFRVAANEVKYVYLIANEASLTLPEAIADKSLTVSQWLDTYSAGASYTKRNTYDGLKALLDGWTAGFANAADQTKSLFFKDSGSRLPLTEMFRVKTLKSLTPNVEVSEGTIIREQTVKLFLTRAAAKATFRFDFSAFEGIGGEITGVRINGLSQVEYVFPNSATYSPSKYTGNENDGAVNSLDDEKRFITSFSSPTPNAALNFTFDGATAPGAGTDKFVRVPMRKSETIAERGPVYFAESLSGVSTDAFKVQVQIDGQRWLDAKPLSDNILEVPGTNGAARQGIARNTHLKINIKIGASNSILYDVVAAPWTPETYEFDYTQQVGVPSEGLLNFETGTYSSLDKTSGRLVLKNYPQAVSGSFAISTPLGARWDAYLITQSGEQNAIQFILPDGNTTGHISGSVGTRATFRIAPVSAAGTTARHAILQVMVMMPSGLSIPARAILGSDYGKDVQYVTFIQNPQ